MGLLTFLSCLHIIGKESRNDEIWVAGFVRMDKCWIPPYCFVMRKFLKRIVLFAMEHG
jgi:hypothetical protein